MAFLVARVGLVAVLLAAAPQALARTVTIDFEGLLDQEPIGDYYAGGTAGFGSGPGPDFGISFSVNALAFIDSDQGGSGPVANEPSPDTVGSHATGFLVGIEVPTGFTGLSFSYTTGSVNQTLSVDVFELVNGSMTDLAIEVLPGTAAGSGDPTGGQLGVWNRADISFTGIAHGVVFTTPWVVDDVTFTLIPVAAVPALSSWAVALLVLAILGAAWTVERQRSAVAR